MSEVSGKESNPPDEYEVPSPGSGGIIGRFSLSKGGSAILMAGNMQVR